jgi:phytoene dehydrogenase-like protein
MSGTERPDAIVIGASIGGLAAAATLARGGLSVVVLEAHNRIGGLCTTAPLGEGFSAPLVAHALYALDPRIVKELKLAKKGLRFAVRDMPLVGLRPDGRHVVLTRDPHATARVLALHSKADAEAWPAHRKAFLALARALRASWWEEGARGALDDRLEPFRRMGAAAWLDAAFESDALKATLAFDATEGGLSPLEPGSALTLLWRAAQEMCGLQDAVAVPAGGPGALATALAAAAKDAGAEIRTGARVARILTSEHAVTGIELASGETVAAPRVLSSLARHATLCELLEAADAGFGRAMACGRARPRVGEAKIVLALDAPPVFGGIAVPAGARFVLADRLAAHAAAHAAAETGRLAHDPPIEITRPVTGEAALAPSGQHLLSAHIRPVPIDPPEGWEALKPKLLERFYAALAPHMPDLARHATRAEVLVPGDFAARFGHTDDGNTLAHMLSDWQTRICTPVAGLTLCGAAAEPVPAISGRAGRIAAQRILREAKR